MNHEQELTGKTYVKSLLKSRYPESRHHFLHSSDGAGFGRMMADFHVERGYARETGRRTDSIQF